MSEFAILDLAAQAMTVQRGALEMLARNVAAASVCGPGGYTRFVPVVQNSENGPVLQARREHRDGEGRLTEMLAVLDAQRAYESDASLFAAGKRLVEHTLDLERT